MLMGAAGRPLGSLVGPGTTAVADGESDKSGHHHHTISPVLGVQPEREGPHSCTARKEFDGDAVAKARDLRTVRRCVPFRWR